LQEALDAAVGGDIIYVAQGSYSPNTTYDFDSGLAFPLTARSASFKIPSDVSVYGGFAGNENPITPTVLANRNFILNETILEGDINDDDIYNVGADGLGTSLGNGFENPFHVVFTFDASAQTLLDGFTITGGNANAANSNGQGGGWYNNTSIGGTSSPVGRNLRFFQNYGAEGGAIYNNGIGNVTNPTFEDCVFEQNLANTFGGAIYNNGVAGEASPNLTNCLFLENVARNSGGEGGAIYNNGFNGGLSNSSITACRFERNKAGGEGGAIHNYGSSNASAGTANPTITNCLFFDNRVPFGDGGAIYNDSGISGTTQIINCTLAENEADAQGGAVYNTESVSVVNSIFWNNTSGTGGESWHSSFGTSFVIAHSLIEEMQTAVIGTNYGGTTLNNGMIYNTDPLFTNSASGTLTLEPCSPAIDAGNSASTTAVTDIEGNTRVQGTQIDMGAHESSTTPATPSVSVSLGSTSENEDDGITFVFTFTASEISCNDLTINFMVSGTADFSSDYTQSGADTFLSDSGTVTIPAGLLNKKVLITPTADMAIEPDETVVLTIQAP
ncbi:MAG: choice-of-anchor Q domain-containing protein, partial [Bacteroidota bacterium]